MSNADVQTILSGDSSAVKAMLKTNPSRAMKAVAATQAMIPLMRMVDRENAQQAVSHAYSVIAAEVAINSDGDAFAVRPKSLNHAGRIPFGFSVLIAAGGVGEVELRAPVALRPIELLIPETIAPGLLITNLQSGQRSYLLAGNSVPCEIFSDNSNAIDWKYDTLQVGQSIKMNFSNGNGDAVLLTGAWMCDYVDS